MPESIVTLQGKLKYLIWILIIIYSLLTFAVTYYDGFTLSSLIRSTFILFYIITLCNINTKNLFGLAMFVGIEIFTACISTILFIFNILATFITIEDKNIKWNSLEWANLVVIIAAFICIILIKVTSAVICLKLLNAIINEPNMIHDSNNVSSNEQHNDDQVQTGLLSSFEEEYVPSYVQNEQGDIMMMLMPKNQMMYE